MKAMLRLLPTVMSFLIATLNAQTTHALSVDLSEADAARQVNGSIVIYVTIKNNSSKQVSLARSGAFFDYSVIFNDASRHPVPFTAEGRKIRTGIGSGFVIGSGKGIELQPGESLRDEIDLRRFYDLRNPGIYTLQVSRKIADPYDTVTSNVLSINVK